MTDHSSRIARLSVYIQVLQELDKDGKWQHSPLLRAYLRDHYCLSLKQADELEIFLAGEVDHVEANFKHKQIELFKVEEVGTGLNLD